jgi:hypothetical protein
MREVQSVCVNGACARCSAVRTFNSCASNTDTQPFTPMYMTVMRRVNRHPNVSTRPRTYVHAVAFDSATGPVQHSGDLISSVSPTARQDDPVSSSAKDREQAHGGIPRMISGADEG